jgi:hypothetical protein
MAVASRSVVVTGAREIAAEFALDAAEVEAACRDLTRQNAQELRRRIQENANTGIHGPREPHIPGTGPGPNVITGDYVRSWQVTYRDATGRFTGGGRAVSASVWTNAPQANRLEYGFWGMTDRIGRTFHQPAYPHIGPAVDEIEERFAVQLDAVVASIAGRGPRVVFSG